MEFYQENMRDTFGKTLVELGEKYDNVVVLDADLCTSTMASLFRDRFPKRFFQCGIAEANMMGMAAGLANLGYIVFPSTFASFAARRALDPIYMQIAGHNANVKIPGSYAGLTATECGMSHNSCEDIGVFSSLPNVKVADLGDNRELRAAMHAFAETEGPVYYRVAKFDAPVLFGEDYLFQWGKGYVLRDGSDVTLMSTGMMTGIALKAADLLKNQGISARVVHMPSIKPLDEALVRTCAEETAGIIALENGQAFGGFGSIVAEAASRLHPTRVEQIGVARNTFAQSDNLYNLLKYHRMTPADVAAHAVEMLKDLK
ncbi:MAG: transketolase family protein [Muribaculaceae bacterium]|nr:transketolase family protein [Muribaculaceae bacterium]